jgi:hypothetical protein
MTALPTFNPTHTNASRAKPRRLRALAAARPVGKAWGFIKALASAVSWLPGQPMRHRSSGALVQALLGSAT